MYPALVGNVALDFTLPDAEGRLRALSEFHETGPVVAVFVSDIAAWRVRWRLRNLLKKYDELIQAGTEVVVVAGDSFDELRRFQTLTGLPFIFLSDRDGAIASRYQLYAHGRRLTAILVVDATGIIRYRRHEWLLTGSSARRIVRAARHAHLPPLLQPRRFSKSA
jgi:peroxiredoxin